MYIHSCTQQYSKKLPAMSLISIFILQCVYKKICMRKRKILYYVPSFKLETFIFCKENIYEVKGILDENYKYNYHYRA